jgi:hypothetical protein
MGTNELHPHFVVMSFFGHLKELTPINTILVKSLTKGKETFFDRKISIHFEQQT